MVLKFSRKILKDFIGTTNPPGSRAYLSVKIKDRRGCMAWHISSPCLKPGLSVPFYLYPFSGERSFGQTE
jgi:hypothetical protein